MSRYALPPGYKTPLACSEMYLIFYDILKLQKAGKFLKKYFDQHCSVACIEMLYFIRLQAPPLTPQVFKPSFVVL